MIEKRNATSCTCLVNYARFELEEIKNKEKDMKKVVKAEGARKCFPMRSDHIPFSYPGKDIRACAI